MIPADAETIISYSQQLQDQRVRNQLVNVLSGERLLLCAGSDVLQAVRNLEATCADVRRRMKGTVQG